MKILNKIDLTSKNKNPKIEFSFVSEHSATIRTTIEKRLFLRGEGVCISLIGHLSLPEMKFWRKLNFFLQKNSETLNENFVVQKNIHFYISFRMLRISWDILFGGKGRYLHIVKQAGQARPVTLLLNEDMIFIFNTNRNILATYFELEKNMWLTKIITIVWNICKKIKLT